MKIVGRILSLMILAGLATFYISCDGGGGENKPEEQVQLEALSKTWTLTSAKLDNVDKTTLFPSLKLTLSGSFVQGGTYNYSFTGTRPTPSPWPQNGTWKFGSSVSSQIVRDPTTDNFAMTYSLSGSELTIQFTCSSCDYAGGTSRANSVNGFWEFKFSNP